MDNQFFNRMDNLIEYVVYRTIDLVNKLKNCFPTAQFRGNDDIHGIHGNHRSLHNGYERMYKMTE